MLYINVNLCPNRAQKDKGKFTNTAVKNNIIPLNTFKNKLLTTLAPPML
jgi:hypothetical protein